MSTRPPLAVLILAVVTPFAAGCIAAAGAAAEPLGPAYTERGARSEVTASADSVTRAVESTFSSMEIAITERSRKEDGSETHLKGKNGDIEVNVDITRDQSQTTKIQVTARRNLVDYDRDYARDILRKVLERLT
jgi:hypothetical protein